jgi:hypothetical protein
MCGATSVLQQLAEFADNFCSFVEQLRDARIQQVKLCVVYMSSIVAGSDESEPIRLIALSNTQLCPDDAVSVDAASLCRRPLVDSGSATGMGPGVNADVLRVTSGFGGPKPSMGCALEPALIRERGFAFVLVLPWALSWEFKGQCRCACDLCLDACGEGAAPVAF